MMTPAKTRCYPLAQWIALCLFALLLPGCGGALHQSPQNPQTQTPIQIPPPAPPIATSPPFPRTAPAAVALNGMDDADFESRKREFENAPGYTAVDWDLIDIGPLEDRRARGTDRGLELINAAAAYARGGTGKGETVAVFDYKIYRDHEVFAARDSEGAVTYSKVTFVPNDIEDGRKEHGTAVAGLIAAKRLANGIMHGVAFDAEVVGRTYIGTRISLDIYS